jgi:hypothetical protein
MQNEKIENVYLAYDVREFKEAFEKKLAHIEKINRL